jgi:hypothetical protein
MEAHDVMLVVPLGLEPGQAGLARDLDQAPVVGIERALGFEVLDSVPNVADFAYTAHGIPF